MKKIITTLSLILLCSVGFSGNNTSNKYLNIDLHDVQMTEIQNEMKVSELIGLSENVISEELNEKLNLIGISFGHGIFATYEECRNFDPECVCSPHSGMRWICFIR